MNRIPKASKKNTKGATFKEAAFEVLKPILQASREKGFQVAGQLAIWCDGAKFPLVFMSMPNKSYMCWWIENGIHRLFALVNEEEKEIGSFGPDELAQFQLKLTEIQKKLGADE